MHTTMLAEAGSFFFQKLIFDALSVPDTILARVAFDAVVILAVFIPAVMVFAMFAIWWERKVAGHMQSRLGPNRVGPIGILQSLADGIKLLTKEDLMPGCADGLLSGWRHTWHSRRRSRRSWHCRLRQTSALSRD